VTEAVFAFSLIVDFESTTLCLAKQMLYRLSYIHLLRRAASVATRSFGPRNTTRHVPFASRATQRFFSIPSRTSPRREPIALRPSPWSRNLGQEHYPFSYRMTGWFCSEVGTTRYTPLANVPRRDGRLSRRSFHYTSIVVSSIRFVNEACLAAPSRLALMDQRWRTISGAGL